MAKIKLTIEHAPVEPIKRFPTWADLGTVRALRENLRATGWGLRVPLAHCPMPKPDQWVRLRRFDGDWVSVQVCAVLCFDNEYAYCTVYGE